MGDLRGSGPCRTSALEHRILSESRKPKRGLLMIEMRDQKSIWKQTLGSDMSLNLLLFVIK